MLFYFPIFFSSSSLPILFFRSPSVFHYFLYHFFVSDYLVFIKAILHFLLFFIIFYLLFFPIFFINSLLPVLLPPFPSILHHFLYHLFIPFPLLILNWCRYYFFLPFPLPSLHILPLSLNYSYLCTCVLT